MPGSRSGIDLIRSIKDERPETLIIVITAHGTVETAVQAMRLGAHDYIAKPVDLEMLGLHVRRAFERGRHRYPAAAIGVAGPPSRRGSGAEPTSRWVTLTS